MPMLRRRLTVIVVVRWRSRVPGRRARAAGHGPRTALTRPCASGRARGKPQQPMTSRGGVRGGRPGGITQVGRMWTRSQPATRGRVVLRRVALHRVARVEAASHVRACAPRRAHGCGDEKPTPPPGHRRARIEVADSGVQGEGCARMVWTAHHHHDDVACVCHLIIALRRGRRGSSSVIQAARLVICDPSCTSKGEGRPRGRSATERLPSAPPRSVIDTALTAACP